ncbi:MAG: Glutathione S-transferase domain [Sphingomonadales bacterium]|jgi:glutathione S-transferase|nr:Glutathione S-transferase domain [Sphingomonadales bacterium]
MTLTLHFHPLSSYCWKALIALYEADLPFVPKLIDLGDPSARAGFAALWPMAKMPVLEVDGGVIAEATIIIEYLARHFPAAAGLVPEDADAARAVRFADRIYDLHLQNNMQKIVGDRNRLAENRDPYGVAEARVMLAAACKMVDDDMVGHDWAVGDRFTMADCAAAPALFYADKVMPLADRYPNAAAFLDRLKARPSFARVLVEAEPWAQYFPTE